MNEHLLLRAIRGEELERPPVWLMRQAGRILPEYRAVRNSLRGFKELVETPHLAAEVTVQPVDILDVDAAIIFSDILVIPDALGLPYRMEKGVGPVFDRTLQTESDVQQLKGEQAAEDLGYVYKAIEETKRILNDSVPLIGFAGAPWTLMAYMIEGGGSKTFSKARRFLYQYPKLSHQLLEKITRATIAYLKLQIKAGADVVQVFDSWAGILSQAQYREFAIPYLGMIADSITHVPVTLFAKDAHYALPELAALSCDTIGLDWTMDPKQAREQVGEKCLQGNLDPCILYASDEEIVKQTNQMLAKFGNKRHIANLGHGVYPDTDPEKVKVFIQTVKAHKF